MRSRCFPRRAASSATRAISTSFDPDAASTRRSSRASAERTESRARCRASMAPSYRRAMCCTSKAWIFSRRFRARSSSARSCRGPFEPVGSGPSPYDTIVDHGAIVTQAFADDRHPPRWRAHSRRDRTSAFRPARVGDSFARRDGARRRHRDRRRCDRTGVLRRAGQLRPHRGRSGGRCARSCTTCRDRDRSSRRADRIRGRPTARDRARGRWFYRQSRRAGRFRALGLRTLYVRRDRDLRRAAARRDRNAALDRRDTRVDCRRVPGGGASCSDASGHCSA